jgi:hypothetical protein
MSHRIAGRQAGLYASFLRLLLAGLAGVQAQAAPAAPAAWTVRPEAVKAHEDFLAGEALQGRGSATRDEAIAAAYVASQFASFGLQKPPGMDNFLQTATVIMPELGGAPVLRIGSRPMPGLALLSAPPRPVSGRLAFVATDDPAAIPSGEVLAIASTRLSLQQMASGARRAGAKLLIVRQSEDTDRIWKGMGGRTRISPYLDGQQPDAMAIAILPAAAFDRLASRRGKIVSLELPGLVLERRTTTNAIGYLPGSDPAAGVILLSAHLDHLGRLADGTIMPGANDDASGTTAVIELARALAAGPRSRRAILFACYGSEEIGGLGSTFFVEHPPVPLESIAANIEFEMIGAQDPKLPAGTMMMTGFERSNLGEALAAHGALVTGDPYPEQNFFQRSDNYQLALKGVVAHTISGWAVSPDYHAPTDTVDRLDIPFMTRAIQSLVEPLRSLAAGDFRPEWKGEGRPVPRGGAR